MAKRTPLIATVLLGVILATPAAAAECVAGAPVEIDWNGSWYPGAVVEGPNDNGECFVTFDGYGEAWDTWIAPASLRPPGEGGLCTEGSAVEIEWEGDWYAGVALEGPNDVGECYVTFDGWEAHWDRWTPLATLRPLSGAALCAEGRQIEIMWTGQWYAGSVIGGPNEAGQCQVSYDDYGADWDNWVPLGDIRAR